MIFDYEQGSPEWFEARIGSIGGSSIQSVCAKGTGKTRKSLLYRFAGEILSGEKYEGYQNEHMQRGIEQEAEARKAYELFYDKTINQVGLVRRNSHYKHYSPDGFENPDGIIEIKCRIPSTYIETVLTNKVPAVDRKQIQWGLHICEREYCKFISYSPTVKVNPLHVIHVERDEKLIKTLDEEADKFVEEMLSIVERIKRG